MYDKDYLGLILVGLVGLACCACNATHRFKVGVSAYGIDVGVSWMPMFTPAQATNSVLPDSQFNAKTGGAAPKAKPQTNSFGGFSVFH